MHAILTIGNRGAQDGLILDRETARGQTRIITKNLNEFTGRNYSPKTAERKAGFAAGKELYRISETQRFVQWFICAYAENDARAERLERFLLDLFERARRARRGFSPFRRVRSFWEADAEFTLLMSQLRLAMIGGNGAHARQLVAQMVVGVREMEEAVIYETAGFDGGFDGGGGDELLLLAGGAGAGRY